MTKLMNRKAPKYLEDLFRSRQSKSSLVLRDALNKLEILMPTKLWIALNSLSVTVELFCIINCPQMNAKLRVPFTIQLRVMSSDSCGSPLKLLINNACILVQTIGIVHGYHVKQL